MSFRQRNYSVTVRHTYFETEFGNKEYIFYKKSTIIPTLLCKARMFCLRSKHKFKISYANRQKITVVWKGTNSYIDVRTHVQSFCLAVGLIFQKR